jgi:hypothetical protein
MEAIMSKNLRDEINRLKGEIKLLKAAIAENPSGRYWRALGARQLDLGKVVDKLARIELARPIRPNTLRTNHPARAMGLTAAELAWLEGKAPAPSFEGREKELNTIRREYWGAAA